MKEEWRDIPGYTNYYQASSIGRIRSVDRVIARSDGTSASYKGRVLKPYSDGTRGYLKVSLHKGTSRKDPKIHRLIYSAFKGSIRHTINHIDSDKLNNTIDNLEDITNQKNCELGRSKMYVVSYKGGSKLDIFNLTAFCREKGLTRANLYATRSGRQSQHKGWTLWQ